MNEQDENIAKQAVIQESEQLPLGETDQNLFLEISEQELNQMKLALQGFGNCDQLSKNNSDIRPLFSYGSFTSSSLMKLLQVATEEKSRLGKSSYRSSNTFRKAK